MQSTGNHSGESWIQEEKQNRFIIQKEVKKTSKNQTIWSWWCNSFKELQSNQNLISWKYRSALNMALEYVYCFTVHIISLCIPISLPFFPIWRSLNTFLIFSLFLAEDFLPGRDKSPGGSLSVLVKLLCSLLQSCRMSPPACILSSGSPRRVNVNESNSQRQQIFTSVTQ